MARSDGFLGLLINRHVKKLRTPFFSPAVDTVCKAGIETGMEPFQVGNNEKG
jgi:hypothetical protein